MFPDQGTSLYYLCGAYKDEAQFARRSDNRADGYQAHCLDCQAEKNRSYYAANQERIKARALARKQAIREGTYREGANPQQGRQKRRVELIRAAMAAERAERRKPEHDA